MKWQISTKGGHGTDSHPFKSRNDSWGQFGRPSIGFSCGSGWHCNPQPFKPSLLVIHSCMDPLHLLTISVQIWSTSSPCSVASVLHASLNFVHLQGLIYKHGPYKSLRICHEICDSGLTRMLMTLEQLEYVSVPSSLLSGNLCLGVCYNKL